MHLKVLHYAMEKESFLTSILYKLKNKTTFDNKRHIKDT